jgi:hypothetical protein
MVLTPDSGHSGMKKGFVLKKVQMAPGLLLGVVGFAGLAALRARKGVSSFEIQEQIQPFSGQIELRVTHKPWLP